MCLAKAYIGSEEHKEEVMRDVAWIGIEREGVVMVDLLGERRVAQARIKSVDLIHGIIMLEGDETNGTE
ncbi:MAG: CooT family nickel-binding protein [Anaerolineales bacterium]|jgi:predicted RNA-binding protein